MNLKTLDKITYGMYLITSKCDGRINGQIANAIIQVTAEPPKLAVSLHNDNLTCEFIKKSSLFCISILPEDFPLKLIGLFGFKSGRVVEKFNGIDYRLTKNGLPYLPQTVGYIECKTVEYVNVGTHTIFIGEVIDCELLNDTNPMTYQYYHYIKRGGNSKNAPHYQKT